MEWVVRISVEGYPITFNLLTQRIDRQVAYLEAVAGVATQPGADPQVEAGQAPPGGDGLCHAILGAGGAK